MSGSGEKKALDSPSSEKDKMDKLMELMNTLALDVSCIKELVVQNPVVQNPQSKRVILLQDAEEETNDVEDTRYSQFGYTLGDTLGSGLYSVYKATSDAGTFAIKRINLKNGEITPSIARELSIMFDLCHDNIVRLCTAFVHGKDICLVMELMHSDLNDYLSYNFKLSLETIKLWLKQILSAIEYMHGRGILHRDLKPENLLLTSDKATIKVADFGLSRLISYRLTPQVTTLQFRAPELLFGSENYTSAVDIWSIGCILWNLVNGQPLFEEETEEGILMEIFRIFGCPCESTWPGVTSLPNFPAEIPLESDAEDFSSLVLNLDPTTIDLLKKMLCLVPSKRITAREALEHEFFKD